MLINLKTRVLIFFCIVYVSKDFQLKTLVFLISLVLFHSEFAFSSKHSPSVIYGEDNRKDVFETTNKSFLQLAKSTAAMIENSKLVMNGSKFEIEGQTLESKGVCKKERFSQQITAAICSGFLVAPNMLLTAGHCVMQEKNCRDYKWVFDFKLESADQKKVIVPSTSVVACKKIVSRRLDSGKGEDYALIEIDTKVSDRSPVRFLRNGKAMEGDSLVVIGHPKGLPTKIADDAVVRAVYPKYFTANLDSFRGNSGSPVFNTQTQEAVGILVRGNTDYTLSRADRCFISIRCETESCRGEDVIHIENITKLEEFLRLYETEN